MKIIDAFEHHGRMNRSTAKVTANDDGSYPSLVVEQEPWSDIGGAGSAIYLSASQVDWLIAVLPQLRRHL